MVDPKRGTQKSPFKNAGKGLSLFLVFEIAFVCFAARSPLECKIGAAGVHE